MRKLLGILLIATLGLCMFTACNPESKATEELVGVRLLTGAETRDLSAEVAFDTTGLTWKYTARKADTGLTTGQTGENEADAVALNSSNQTAALSQGLWNFVLYGYKDTTCTKLVCVGSVDNKLITTKDYTVTIAVEPQQKATGTIKIADDINITDIKGEAYSSYGTASDIYNRKIEAYHLSGTTWEKLTLGTASGAYYTIADVGSGICKIEVTFTLESGIDTDTAIAATATKYINVYDYLTTTVSGTITETAQAAEITVDNAKIVAEGNYTDEQVITANSFDTTSLTNTNEITIKSAITGVGRAEDATAEDAKITEIQFARETLKKTDATGEDAVLKIESVSAAVANEENSGYLITTNNGAIVQGVKFTLENATFEKGDDKIATITTYIEPGLTEKNWDSSSSDGETCPLSMPYVDSSEAAGEVISYDTSTGKLVAEVSHFSRYVIVSSEIYAIDSNGKLYRSLQAAFDGATAESTVTLLQDVVLADDVTVSKNITLDFGEKAIKAEDHLIIVNAGTLTLKGETTRKNYVQGVFNAGTGNSAYTRAEAKIGATYYSTLSDGFSADSTGEMTLLQNVILESDIVVKKTITLNMNGKTLVPADGLLVVGKDATLTISGSASDQKAFVQGIFGGQSGIDGAYTYVAAEVGGKYYADLTSAIDAAEIGSEIDLLNDYTGDVTLNGKNLTFDFNGHTINGSVVIGCSGAGFYSVSDKTPSTIVFEDSGEGGGIKTKDLSKAALAIRNKSDVTINGGSYVTEGEGSWSKKGDAVVLIFDSTLTINDGSFKSKVTGDYNKYADIISVGFNSSSGDETSATINITGGDFSTDSVSWGRIIDVPHKNSTLNLTIDNGTFSTDGTWGYLATKPKYGKIVVNNCKFTAKKAGNVFDVMNVEYKAYNERTVVTEGNEIEVNGGVFTVGDGTNTDTRGFVYCNCSTETIYEAYGYMPGSLKLNGGKINCGTIHKKILEESNCELVEDTEDSGYYKVTPKKNN